MKLYQSEETNISIRIILQNVGFKKLRRFIAPLDFRGKFEPQIWRGSQCINPTYTRNRDINQDCLDRLPTVRTDDEIEERWINELWVVFRNNVVNQASAWILTEKGVEIQINDQSAIFLCDFMWCNMTSHKILKCPTVLLAWNRRVP